MWHLTENQQTVFIKEDFGKYLPIYVLSKEQLWKKFLVKVQDRARKYEYMYFFRNTYVVGYILTIKAF